MYRILLLGECSREHAIAEAITRSTYKVKLYALMKHLNPGIKQCCEFTGGEVIIGDFLNPNEVVNVCKKYGIEIVVVGPEEPLFKGVCNAVEREGINCIGPCKEAAKIEQSKAFMRKIMWKYKISGRLRFYTFSNINELVEFMKDFHESIAIKPARQVGGKGVKVISDLQIYLRDVRSKVKIEHSKVILDKIMKGYDDIEDKILIEEKVDGIEYTLQCFTDGVHVLPMPLVQDYKHAFEYGIGPETGGMGSIADKEYTLPFITWDEFEKSVEIVKQIVHAIKLETGVEYKGVIAGQMMLTSIWGPTIIECYSRFGDPEGVNVLSILETDFIEIIEAILNKSLPKIKLKFKPYATVVKAIAPIGYPNDKKLAQGHEIYVNVKKIEEIGCKIYYGSIHFENGKLITVGSRAIEILGIGNSIPEAAEKVNKALKYVYSPNWKLFYRLDIGSKESIEKMIEFAERIREVYRYRQSHGLIGKIIDWIPGKGIIVHEY